MSTLVVGLGNPCLGDDGVGWRVVSEAETLWRDQGLAGSVEFTQASLGGISLMEMLIGFDKAVIVDAIQSRGREKGKLRRLTIDDLPSRHADCVHEASFKDALHLGTSLGARLPGEIVIIGIETGTQLALSEELSPAVEASVSPAARLILAEVS